MKKLKIDFSHIELGMVDTIRNLTRDERSKLSKAFAPLGFELLEDKTSTIIESIKTILVTLLRDQIEDEFQLSTYLQDRLRKEYSSISKLFSEVEGITIERYFILLKVERVKELMVYDELSLAQISDQLGYSSPAHLSAQFKQLTGLPPSHFKKMAEAKRIPLNEVI